MGRASHQFSAAEVDLLSDLLSRVLYEKPARDLVVSDEFASLARKVQTMVKSSRGERR